MTHQNGPRSCGPSHEEQALLDGVAKGCICRNVGFRVLKSMEALVRSRPMGVTGKRVEKSGIGRGARTAVLQTYFSCQSPLGAIP